MQKKKKKKKKKKIGKTFIVCYIIASKLVALNCPY